MLKLSIRISRGVLTLQVVSRRCVLQLSSIFHRWKQQLKSLPETVGGDFCYGVLYAFC